MALRKKMRNRSQGTGMLGQPVLSRKQVKPMTAGRSAVPVTEQRGKSAPGGFEVNASGNKRGGKLFRTQQVRGGELHFYEGRAKPVFVKKEGNASAGPPKLPTPTGTSGASTTPDRTYKRPTPPSDARSQNPVMGGHPSKAGYAIPYDDDTSRSPYKPGRGRRRRRGRVLVTKTAS